MPRMWSEYHSLNDSGLDINKNLKLLIGDIYL